MNVGFSKKMRYGLMTSIFLLVGLCLSFTVNAEELEPSEVEVEIVTEDTLIANQPESYDNEELFAEYFFNEMETSIEEVNTEGNLLQNSYSARRVSTLDSDEQLMYAYWLSSIRAIASGDASQTVIQIPVSAFLSKYTYTAADLGMSEITSINSSVDAAVKRSVLPDLNSVYLALLADCPYDMYWHDKTAGVAVGYGFSYTLANNGVENVIVVGTGSFIQLSMAVSSDYQASAYVTDTTKTGATAATVANAISVVNAISSGTDYEKLVYYRDWITQNVSYNFSAVYTPTAYGDPWQIIYVFDGDASTKVTCEGYAKAFKYLCDLSSFSDSDIDCYLMTGTMDGNAHMWNSVFMDDNQNYLVDLTNYSSTYPSHLFLAGYVNTTANGYGFYVQDAVCTYLYDNDCISTYSALERTIASTNYGSQTNYSDSVEAFVARLYRVILQREPDASGLAHWVHSLKTGNKTAADVVVGFYLSTEMLNRGLSNSDYVESAYLGMMNRASDASGKAHWMQLLDAGASYQYIISRFVASAEFSNLCAEYGITKGSVALTQYRDQNLGVTQFVSRLYTKTLGRTYDVDGLNHWCQRILNNTSRANVYDVALTGFLHSTEFKNKNLSNGEYVKVLYRTFLNREYDSSGYAHWMAVLNSGVSRDEVARRFAYSEEFSNIMAVYGL